MKLTTRCSSCKKDIKIKYSASTRPDLQMERGDEFIVNCQNCGKIEKKHVNDVRAEINNIVILSGIGLAIIAKLGIWMVSGRIGYAAIGLGIPILLWYQQMDATKGFNSYRIRRK